MEQSKAWWSREVKLPSIHLSTTSMAIFFVCSLALVLLRNLLPHEKTWQVVVRGVVRSAPALPLDGLEIDLFLPDSGRLLKADGRQYSRVINLKRAPTLREMENDRETAGASFSAHDAAASRSWKRESSQSSQYRVTWDKPGSFELTAVFGAVNEPNRFCLCFRHPACRPLWTQPALLEMEFPGNYFLGKDVDVTLEPSAQSNGEEQHQVETTTLATPK